MREIKFRAWDKIKKRIVRVSGWGEHLGINIGDVDGVGFNQSLQEGDFEIMQYTGLKDKNDKEIYEGDIVRAEYHTIGYDFNGEPQELIEHVLEEVIYEDLAFCINPPGLMVELSEECEVIGNKFENPELLK